MGDGMRSLCVWKNIAHKERGIENGAGLSYLRQETDVGATVDHPLRDLEHETGAF